MSLQMATVNDQQVIRRYSPDFCKGMEVLVILGTLRLLSEVA